MKFSKIYIFTICQYTDRWAKYSLYLDNISTIHYVFKIFIKIFIESKKSFKTVFQVQILKNQRKIILLLWSEGSLDIQPKAWLLVRSEKISSTMYAAKTCYPKFDILTATYESVNITLTSFVEQSREPCCMFMWYAQDEHYFQLSLSSWETEKLFTDFEVKFYVSSHNCEIQSPCVLPHLLLHHVQFQILFFFSFYKLFPTWCARCSLNYLSPSFSCMSPSISH